MKFKVIINKPANFYFFVQNLAEWHFSCRTSYNKFWEKELGPLSLAEKKMLEQFKKVRLKYPEGKSIFEQCFFKKGVEPLRRLRKELSPEDHNVVKITLELFKNRFEKLYKKDFPRFKKWQQTLNSKINNRRIIGTVDRILCILYNIPARRDVVRVYLLLSSPEQSGGGANVDKKSVALEISRQPHTETAINLSMAIIWHEITHLIYQNHYFYPLLLRYFKLNRKKTDLINEITASLLFPRGILGIRIFKNKPPVKLLPQIGPEETKKLLDLMAGYINKNKQLDRNYIRKIEKILKT